MAVGACWQGPEQCPVPDEMLATLRRATMDEAASFARLLPEDKRTQLALFLYSKSHFRELGKTVAMACTEGSLVRFGAVLGQALVQQRDVLETAPHNHRRAISLARAA